MARIERGGRDREIFGGCMEVGERERERRRVGEDLLMEREGGKEAAVGCEGR